MKKGTDKSADFYKAMEDKWYFTKSYFRNLADKFNFSDLIIYSLHESEKMFETQTKQVLIYGEIEQNKMPEWAWEIVREFDKGFSEELKQDLLIEGCIIFKK